MVFALWIHVAACVAVWHLWVRRNPALALDGWGLASMSSGLDGDGGAPPPGGRPPIGEVRARIVAPWMQRKIRGWLHRLLIPAQEREDVAQMVTLEALRSAHTFDPSTASLERWMNGITVHAAAHWRDRAHPRREVLPGEIPELEDVAPPADVAIGAEDDRLLVLEALQLVPLDLRAIVVAHEIHGIPMREVAERSRLTLSTAYKWRARGLAALADALRKLRR